VSGILPSTPRQRDTEHYRNDEPAQQHVVDYHRRIRNVIASKANGNAINTHRAQKSNSLTVSPATSAGLS
jgi:hypothetical protein